MNKIFVFYLLFVFPKLILSDSSGFDYSSYSAKTKNSGSTGRTIETSTSKENSVSITESGISISNITIIKSGYINAKADYREF